MWRSEQEDINVNHLLSEFFYICRLLAVVFWLLGLTRSGDVVRQFQSYHSGMPTTINPFWLVFNSVIAVSFFIVGVFLWLESKGPKIKRDRYAPPPSS